MTIHLKSLGQKTGLTAQGNAERISYNPELAVTNTPSTTDADRHTSARQDDRPLVPRNPHHTPGRGPAAGTPAGGTPLNAGGRVRALFDKGLAKHGLRYDDVYRLCWTCGKARHGRDYQCIPHRLYNKDDAGEMICKFVKGEISL